MQKFLLPFKKTLAMFFGLFFVLMTAGQTVKPIEPLDKNNIKLNVAIMSDVHMEGNVVEKFSFIPKCMNSLNGGKDYIDALALVGDNVMCAQDIENMFFYGVMNNVNPIRPYFPAVGNHDVGNDDPDFGTYEELRERTLGYMQSFVDESITELYYSKVVNGYHLIFLGPDTAECHTRNFSDKQLDWFEAQLDEAAESGKPIFVFNHHPFYSVGQGFSRYISLLNKYDNIFVIIGHMHYYTDYDIVPGDKGTPQILIPSLWDNDEQGLGYQMEVYENQVNFRGYNYYKGSFTDNSYTFTLAEQIIL